MKVVSVPLFRKRIDEEILSKDYNYYYNTNTPGYLCIFREKSNIVEYLYVDDTTQQYYKWAKEEYFNTFKNSPDIIGPMSNKRLLIILKLGL